MIQKPINSPIGLFVGEAETLEQLGHHDQIPRLLAYFEAQYSFYLVEELIEGHLLQQELAARRPMPQLYVLDLLKNLLPIVEFVHSKHVIHRDIKPANIIRRQSDKRLVLIDFGAVKQISNQLTDMHAQPTATVGIGTQGYMPSEQSAGLPRLCSDLYAIGIIAIEALTGIPAYALQRDKAGEVIWRFEVPDMDPQFADILLKLTRYNFSDRYQRATEVLADLEPIEAILRSQSSEAEAEVLQILESPTAASADEPVSDFDNIGTQALPEGWGAMTADTATRDQQQTQVIVDDSTQVLPLDWADQAVDPENAITQEQMHTRQE
jgi:serine/threonine protein kinase